MEKDIGKIQKNDTSDIIIRVDDFAGNRGLTVREFVTSERYTGFTKAGVRILAKDFPKFKEMINSISEDEMNETPEGAEEAPAAAPEKGKAPATTEATSETPKEDAPVAEKPKEAPKEELPDY